MLTDDILARLEQLNRSRLPSTLGAAKPLVAQRLDSFSPQAVPDISDDFSLESLAPGEVVETASGPCYVIRRPLADVWPRGTLHPPLPDLVPQQHPELSAFAHHFPDRVLFLDLETCGLAGSAMFLAGLIHRLEGVLVLEQLLARTYAEERAILEVLWRRATSIDVLVTFNGKSFDWPLVRDRSTYHRLGTELTGDFDSSPENRIVHLDVLHHARRRWRHKLPNCKLQTLEWAVCRRMRHNDIPGSQVPQEYHHFVRTGDARMLRAILHHNALDLVTLAELAIKLSYAEQEPRRSSSAVS
jgi:uncharacterized protein YprB with RNaseH-like and TPR domain